MYQEYQGNTKQFCCCEIRLFSLLTQSFARITLVHNRKEESWFLHRFLFFTKSFLSNCLWYCFLKLLGSPTIYKIGINIRNTKGIPNSFAAVKSDYFPCKLSLCLGLPRYITEKKNHSFCKDFFFHNFFSKYLW